MAKMRVVIRQLMTTTMKKTSYYILTEAGRDDVYDGGRVGRGRIIDVKGREVEKRMA